MKEGAMSEQVTINRTQAYKEIAKLVYPDDPVATGSERVRLRAYRAQQAGKIVPSPMADASFCNWVRETWPKLPKQNWMPRRRHRGSGSATLIFDASATAHVTPQDPEELVRRLRETTEQLEAADRECKATTQALQDERKAREAAEYRLKNRLKKQSDFGKKGGRGNTF